MFYYVNYVYVSDLTRACFVASIMVLGEAIVGWPTSDIIFSGVVSYHLDAGKFSILNLIKYRYLNILFCSDRMVWCT